MQTIKNVPQTKQDVKVEEHNQKWIDYLCDYGSKLEYQEIADKSKNAMFAIMEYRRLLRGRDLGNIPLIALNTAYIQRNYNRLHILLQELFLEAIPCNKFKFILEQLDSVDNGMVKLYDKHLQDKNKRALNRALVL